MSVIVAFGDSNTWGFNPANGARYARELRYVSVLQRELGAAFEVIAEGLNGRTTIFDDPIEPGRRGADYLVPCLRSHAPVDLVILALGINDLKARFSATPADVAGGMQRLITLTRQAGAGPGGVAPAILVVAPPPLAATPALAEAFAGGPEKSRLLPERYRAVAELNRVGFVDAGGFIRASARDGVHFEPDAHATLGQALAEAARMLLS